MNQLSLPGIQPPENVVNVASVKHRSPFRYPGGKTWFVPRARTWLKSLSPDRRTRFVEPFAGGGIVGLTVAFENLAEHVILVELDSQVAAVWKTIISDGRGEWLAHRIETFEFNAETVEAVLRQQELLVPEQAFQTIIKNRVNRGGILASGAGRMKAGENGKGLASRWYPGTLARRIRDIAAIRDRLTFIHGDGLDVMENYAACSDTVFFIDPPYSSAGKKAGRRLYTHFHLDHVDLFHAVKKLKGDFLITYGNAHEIKSLAEKYGFDYTLIAMKNTHHAKLTELLIGRDLQWI